MLSSPRGPLGHISCFHYTSVAQLSTLNCEISSNYPRFYPWETFGRKSPQIPPPSPALPRSFPGMIRKGWIKQFLVFCISHDIYSDDLNVTPGFKKVLVS
jgi:hypothetical protein